MKTIHYAGSIDWHGGKILAGWAACCSGERAEKIRERGEHTRGVGAVTCKACLKMLDKQAAFRRDMASRDQLVAAIAKCDAECGVYPASLSNLIHLHEDHDGPHPADAQFAMKFCSGSFKEQLEKIGLRVRYMPKWVEDIQITRIDNWKLEVPHDDA